MNRILHPVTCKVALYNQAKTAVLLTEYRKNEFGLPGGHIESGETPDEAVGREVYEELGVILQNTLERKDFWQHPNGKIILGYKGILDESTELKLDFQEVRGARWTTLEDIRNGKITAGTYDAFILGN